MKEGIWLILATAVFIGWKIFRASRMNSDPQQQELRDLILELDRSRKDPENVHIFEIAYHRVLWLDDGQERRSKLAHALSMARPKISSSTYDFVKETFRQDARNA